MRNNSAWSGAWRPISRFALLALWWGVGAALPAVAAPPTAGIEAPVVHDERLTALNKSAPSDLADLRAIETQVTRIVDHVRQSTVAIIVGDSQGSGVIVTESGLVLTAGHVISVPGRKVTVVLADGRKVAGRALGVNTASDCGMVQITDRGPYPASKISDLSTLRVGDWCLGTGHPGGYQTGRPPVVRLGRLVAIHATFLQSDCTLLGGDSGGPLFDLNGNVVGIHSRIGPRTSLNLHVPAALFVRDWDRLSKTPDLDHVSAQSQGMFGVDGVDNPQGARITEVYPRTPADEAGLKIGDIVTGFSGHRVDGFGTLKKFVRARHPGEIIELKVLRENGVRELRATLVARPME
jgi:serine protease Do